MAARQAAAGDTVRVDYRGTFSDGTEFDSSAGREPLQVTLGAGQVIEGFEAALMGMAEGDSKTVTIEAAQAYGEHDPDLLHKVERSQVPAEIDLEIGTELQASDQGGNPIALVVAELTDDTVTLDANHPLAGKDLTFELTVVGFAD